MASIRTSIRKTLAQEFIAGTVYRVDLDRVDVAPAGSAGILHSLPLAGDREKVQPGDPVQVIHIGGEWVALVGDTALGEQEAEAGQLPERWRAEVAEMVGEGRVVEPSAETALTLDNLADVDTASTPPADGALLIWEDAVQQWVPKSGGEVVTPHTHPGSEITTAVANADYAASAGNASQLSGLTAGSFLRRYAKAGATIGSSAGGLFWGELLADGSGSTASAAGFTLHRPNAYACYFGLDTDNYLKIGGWSMGANAYKIFHEGMGSIYVPLANYVQFPTETALTGANTSGGVSGDYSSVVPVGAKAVALQTYIRCTVAGSWIALGPGNASDVQKYHHTAVGWNSANVNAVFGIIAFNAGSRTLYRFHDAKGGTLYYARRVLGYFI